MTISTRTTDRSHFLIFANTYEAALYINHGVNQFYILDTYRTLRNKTIEWNVTLRIKGVVLNREAKRNTMKLRMNEWLFFNSWWTIFQLYHGENKLIFISVVSLTSNSGGYINGRNSANLELLIDKPSPIYLYVKLKALASWIFFEETPTHMSITIKRLEEGHNSYPLVCRRPVDTVSLQRRHICYRWGTPAYWSLVPRSSMFYLFEFCLKNMWNCSLTQ